MPSNSTGSKRKTGFGFNAKNIEAQRWANEYAGDRITNLNEETKLSIRELIEMSINQGAPPKDSAEIIQMMVGLNRPQGIALRRYVDELSPSLSVEAKAKAGLKLKEKMIRRRAITIARTEVIDSLSAGSEQSWIQAQDQGFLGANAKKAWISVGARACVICRDLNRHDPVPLEENFESLIGPLARPTAHPNCRCGIAPVPGGEVSVAGPQPIALRPLSLLGDEVDAEALVNGEVRKQKETKIDGINETVILSGKRYKGVFKPKEGERLLGVRRSIVNEEFTLADREVLAETVDRLLGTNQVPVTRIREAEIQAHGPYEGGMKEGSIQSFFENGTAAADMPREWMRENPNEEDLALQFILDLAIGNTDRHSGNFMLGERMADYDPAQESRYGTRPVASIDNGYTFPQQADIEDGAYFDRLGLSDFRNVTWGGHSNFQPTFEAVREPLMANIDATDWNALARTTKMSAAERGAFVARIEWIREGLEGNDLHEVVREAYAYEGFERKDKIPGILFN